VRNFKQYIRNEYVKIAALPEKPKEKEDGKGKAAASR
jgi:hypothetical protein